MTPPAAIVDPSSTGRNKRIWLLQLAYDGTAYAGWQTQPKQSTVEGTLTAALAHLLPDGAAFRVRGCSRTDAGVHALAQLVRIELPTHPPIPPEGAQKALNSRLPKDIRVRRIRACPSNFDLHGSILGKAYTYVVHEGPLNCPFQGNYSWGLRGQLDLSAIREAARHLTVSGDFTAFTVNARDGREVKPHCRLHDWQIRRRGDFILLTVIGDRFLYRMVRRLTGFLVAVGRGRLEPGLAADLLTGAKEAAFETAPAHGLFLEAVLLTPEELAYQAGDFPFLQFLQA